MTTHWDRKKKLRWAIFNMCIGYGGGFLILVLMVGTTAIESSHYGLTLVETIQLLIAIALITWGSVAARARDNLKEEELHDNQQNNPHL